MPADFLIDAGALALVGPHRGQMRTCVAGRACRLERLQGLYLAPQDGLRIADTCRSRGVAAAVVVALVVFVWLLLVRLFVLVLVLVLVLVPGGGMGIGVMTCLLAREPACLRCARGTGGQPGLGGRVRPRVGGSRFMAP